MTDTNHQSEEIVLELPESGLRISKWTSYSFNSNFLCPTDEFHFTIAHENLPQTERRALESGARVTLSIDGHIQGDGYIDDIYGGNDPKGGSEIVIQGRDRLAQAVDSNMDPRIRFAEGGNLVSFLVKVFSPYGWTDETQIIDGNAANRGVMTGQLRGTKTSKKGKSLKSIACHQLKPYQNEGVFAFASRVAQRHGLWIWLSAEGNLLICAKPSFDTEPLYKLQRTSDASRIANNIKSGGARTSLKNQPSVIVAQGFAGGGEFGKSRMTVIMQNPAVDCDNGAILAAYPDAIVVPLELDGVAPIKGKNARPMFLHDDESHTPEQLQNFVKREMALKMRHSFSANYVVSGHTNSGAPWCVDAMVKVDDERAFPALHESLWIMGRTFTKTRGGSGTETHLELIRPNTLVF